MSQNNVANAGRSQIFVTTDAIPRTSIFAPDFPNVLTRTVEDGWKLWQTTPQGLEETACSGIRVEIGDTIIHDTLKKGSI